MLKENQRAPDFTLLNQNNEKVKLSDFKGKKVLIFFYPKDFTPGCTLENVNLRDSYQELKKANIEVLGISTDNCHAHRKFSEKLKLPYNLLSDFDKKVVKKYGVYGEKSFMGKKFMGTKRVSFLIDEKGKIIKIFDKVDVKNHAKQVLDFLKSL
ncbi:MAG: thioredoxin-dependent thiol peroxidase [Candidatus Aenigmatarchaeota archaeon]